MAKPRDYVQENKTSRARGEIADRVKRNAARRMLKAEGVKIPAGHDVDHKQMLSKSGSNARSNLRVVPASVNRSFPRNADGSAKTKKRKGA